MERPADRDQAPGQVGSNSRGAPVEVSHRRRHPVNLRRQSCQCSPRTILQRRPRRCSPSAGCVSGANLDCGRGGPSGCAPPHTAYMPCTLPRAWILRPNPRPQHQTSKKQLGRISALPSSPSLLRSLVYREGLSKLATRRWTSMTYAEHEVDEYDLR